MTCVPNASVALVSPWVDDLDLLLPNPLRSKGNPNRLSTLLNYLHRERNIHFMLYYREDEHGDLNQLVQRLIKPPVLRLIPRTTTHSKGIATPDLIMHGSPNLRWRSFNVNEENVAVEKNPFASVAEAVIYAFNIR